MCSNNFKSGGRNFGRYTTSTPFPFLRDGNHSQIWEKVFESCPKNPQGFFSPEHSTIQKSPEGLFCIVSFAPAAGFEPATNALHVIQYFRTGTDYIFTIFILR